jgi:uncharacterized DUF497 family protein
MLHVKGLLFDDWNEEHIAEHHVEPEEVEEVCLGHPHTSKTREGKLRVIGQTDSGRYLTVILAYRGQGLYYPVTARDASDSERQLVKRRRR